jgi:hypothetical protein
MRTLHLFALLAALAPFPSLSKLIKNTTKSEFTTYLANNDQLLVSFTSSTFPTLSSYNTIFATASHNLSRPFISINCDTETTLCAQHAIISYPTIRLYKKRQDNAEMKTTRYRGPRTTSSLRAFVKRHDAPLLPYIHPSSLLAFATTNTKIGSVIIAYLYPSETSLLSTFRSTAQKYYGTYIFAYTTTSHSSTPSLHVHNPDGSEHTLPGPFTPNDLEAFLKTSTRSVIKPFREKEMQLFMQRDKLTIYLFTSAPDAQSVLGVRRELTHLAKKYESVTVWGVVDMERYGEMAVNFGVEVDTMTGGEVRLVVHAPINDNAWRYAARGDRIEGEGVEKMVMKILQGEARIGEVFSGSDDEGHDEL